MLNFPIISAAHRNLYTLGVASQICGIPARLIATLVKPQSEAGGMELFSLDDIVNAFTSEAGARLLRKLRQDQLELYRQCRVTWRDEFGLIRTVEDAWVEIRGKRAEITLPDGYRFVREIADSDFGFKGTRV
jgi:hypothetical protein